MRFDDLLHIYLGDLLSLNCPCTIQSTSSFSTKYQLKFFFCRATRSLLMTLMFYTCKRIQHIVSCGFITLYELTTYEINYNSFDNSIIEIFNIPCLLYYILSNSVRFYFTITQSNLTQTYLYILNLLTYLLSYLLNYLISYLFTHLLN